MSWNYRIIHYTQGGYGLHEVYYDDAGQPNGMTERPVGFVADEDEGFTGLIQGLEMALRDARERPVIEEEVIVATSEQIAKSSTTAEPE